MKPSVKRICWLCLTMAALCCSTHPNESYASMVTSDAWQTGMQTSAVRVTGDYLTQGGQTVLLAPLTEARTVNFSVKTDRSQMNGTLSYTVSPGDAVTVQLNDALTATPTGGTGALTLIPGQVTQQTQVTVQVRWTGTDGTVLAGDFTTTLLPDQSQLPEQSENPVQAQWLVGEETVPGAAIPITVQHPADTRQIILSLGDNRAFPAGTVYRLADTKKNITLYDPAQITLPGGGKETVVLLTLPEQALVSLQAIDLEARVLTQTGEAKLTAQTTPLAATLQQPDGICILTAGESCVLDLPGGWSGCSLSYTVEYLTQTATGIEYRTAANTGSQGLSVSGGTGGITLRLAGSDLPAGTYRLKLAWSYQTYTVAQQNVTFYVGYPDLGTTGGNTQ